MCGECCSSWNIPLEGHKAVQLKERAWVQARLQEVRRDLVKLSEDFYRIPLTDENVCVFLADDRRCMVEMHEGLALKPKECQRFPFATIQMPDGSHRHESSAACKHISETLLLAFQPILPKPASEVDLLAEFQRQEEAQFDEIGRLPARIPVTMFRKVDMSQYEAYLTELQAVFTQPNIAPDAALHHIARYLRQPTATNSNVPSSADFSIGSRVARWVIIFFLRKPYRSLSWLSLLQGKHYHDPRVFGLPINLQEQRHIAWNPAQNKLLNAFLFSILHRKRLLANGSSLTSLLAMATVAALLVQWHAKTLAWLQQSDAITETDVSSAIRLVERYYTGHQPRFLQWFTSRWKGWVLVKILLRG
jgi:hypothetical protein